MGQRQRTICSCRGRRSASPAPDPCGWDEVGMRMPKRAASCLLFFRIYLCQPDARRQRACGRLEGQTHAPPRSHTKVPRSPPAGARSLCRAWVSKCCASGQGAIWPAARACSDRNDLRPGRSSGTGSGVRALGGRALAGRGSWRFHQDEGMDSMVGAATAIFQGSAPGAAMAGRSRLESI